MKCEGEECMGHDLFYDANLDGGQKETLKTVDFLVEIPNLTLYNTEQKCYPRNSSNIVHKCRKIRWLMALIREYTGWRRAD